MREILQAAWDSQQNSQKKEPTFDEFEELISKIRISFDHEEDWGRQYWIDILKGNIERAKYEGIDLD